MRPPTLREEGQGKVILKACAGNALMVGMPVNEVKFVVFGQLGDSVRLVVVVPGDLAWQAGDTMPSTIASGVNGPPRSPLPCWQAAVCVDIRSGRANGPTCVAGSLCSAFEPGYGEKS